MKAGDLVEVRSASGNLVKTFEMFPGDYNHNRATWIDVGQVGTILEVRNIRGTDMFYYCKVLLNGSMRWFDHHNLRVVS